MLTTNQQTLTVVASSESRWTLVTSPETVHPERVSPALKHPEVIAAAATITGVLRTLLHVMIANGMMLASSMWSTSQLPQSPESMFSVFVTIARPLLRCGQVVLTLPSSNSLGNTQYFSLVV
eukprot:m.146845 g.146845  ORF g.146845 m.146845 type:complete len:122 (+) comp30503_c0_seq2:849-1214(+)